MEEAAAEVAREQAAAEAAQPDESAEPETDEDGLARFPAQLSGGQKQRVSLMRALMLDPDLLLLDEPLGALDRKLREEMQLEFRRIQRELGVTTINVTHDQREALIMSDEIIVMDRGRIQQKARPAVAYRKPANAFVAGFIGVTNFLPGTAATAPTGAPALTIGTMSLAGAAAAGASPPPPGAPAIGALRAEQVRIAASAAELGELATVVPGVVADTIFEGERIVYEVAVDALGGGTVRVFDHDPALHAEFAVDSPVFLGWNARDLTVFAP